jgi:hypothetical protein
MKDWLSNSKRRRDQRHAYYSGPFQVKTQIKAIDGTIRTSELGLAEA